MKYLEKLVSVSYTHLDVYKRQIGDRLYTDIAMGKKSGITTILVLTGETQKDDVKESPWQPDYVFPSLSDIDFN